MILAHSLRRNCTEAAEEHAAVLRAIDHAARLRPIRWIWQPSSVDDLFPVAPVNPLAPALPPRMLWPIGSVDTSREADCGKSL